MPATAAIHFEGPPEAGDFFFGSVLGQGSYAKVFHARLKKSGTDLAVKVMDQSFIRKENKTAFVLTERKVMSRLLHPNIVRFYCSFRDAQSLYLVMELCRGGDLFGVIINERKKQEENNVSDTACDMRTTKFYAAELVKALEFMHAQRVIHRDIKPDNLLLSEDGHLKVTDFGTAKDQDDKGNDMNQFCGTASYVSPEVLHDKSAGRPADLWALGCVIYQLLTGRTPFIAENDYLTFQVIINHSNDEFDFPDSVPELAQDLIRKLLVQDPEQRIGAEQSEEGYAELRNHPFFEDINWESLAGEESPFIPPKLELPEPKLDGATENWSVAEFFTDDFSESTTDEFSRRSRSGSSMRSNRPSCIMYDEQIRFESTVKIHSKLFNRSRELYLTDAPRLVTVSTWSGRFKSEIPLTHDTKVNPIDSNTFDVIAPSGTFRITDPTNSSQSWVIAISQAVREAE